MCFRLVKSIRNLCTDHRFVIEVCFPTLVNLLQSRFYGCQVNTSITFNIYICLIFGTPDYLRVIVGDAQWRLCSICYKSFEDAVIIACSHTFCRNCLQTWLQDQDTCPACRAPTSTQAMISNRAVHGMMASRQDFQSQRDLDIAAGFAAIIASMQTSYEKLCAAFRRLKT